MGADGGVVKAGEKRGEPQMEKEVKGAGVVRRGRNTEGLVNTALDIHSPLVPVCPSSSFPLFYI